MIKGLVVSIIFNIILVAGIIVSLIGKGIQINPTYKYETNNHSHQEQFQGQLSMNMWMSQGDKVVWVTKTFTNTIEISDILNVLPPQTSYFAKTVTQFKEDCSVLGYIIYPVFLKK